MMNFRKHTCIFLGTLILLVNLGLRFSVHYCKDEIASVSFKYDIQEPCVQKITSCCVKLTSHDSCCSNKVIKVEKKTDDILIKTVQFEFQPAVFFNNSKSNFKTFVSGIVTPNWIGYYCNSNAPPLYKRYCQLVFYA